MSSQVEQSTSEIEHINAALLAFHHAGSMRCEQETSSREWFVFDDQTYDGDPLSLFDSPLDAILDWFEDLKASAAGQVARHQGG